MSDTPVDRVRHVVELINEAFGLGARVEVVEVGDEIHATLHGENLGLLIGRHGATIDAVQHLAYKVASKEGPARVVVDAAGYRARRRHALERQSDQAAEEALRTERPVALESMSATERKVVHEHLKARSGLQTYSEGTEPNRHLVVAPLRR